MKLLRLLPALSSLLAILIIVAAAWGIRQSSGALSGDVPLSSPGSISALTVEVSVEEGDSPQSVGEKLEENGAIESAAQFRALVSLLGYDGRLQAGDYEFDQNTPALSAVYRIRKGIVSTRSVTVVEGWRLEQIAGALAEKGIDRQNFIDAAKAGDYNFGFLEEAIPGESLEGYLFPAVYSFRKRDKASDIVPAMLAAFDKNVPSDLRDEAAASGLSLREVITLASIVEREAQVPQDRPVIAQVFLRRLSLGMPLEADPTVQYALGNDPESVSKYGYWKPELGSEDLAIDSPYNTYVYSGLPPGPICNPGLDSIKAVIHPANTNYLYFVAKPDGSHLFAETLSEHIENIETVRGQ